MPVPCCSQLSLPCSQPVGLCCCLPQPVSPEWWHLQGVTLVNHWQHDSDGKNWTGALATCRHRLLPGGFRFRFHLFSPTCCVGVLITELHVSVPLYLKKIMFSRMIQKFGKQRRRGHRMSCFWSATGTAGGFCAFCLCCDPDSEPSGKAGTGSPLNPLSSANNSGGLTGPCCMKPSAWKSVIEVGLFWSVI